MNGKIIQVWADWQGLSKPSFMGILNCITGRGKEIFSFEYSKEWLGNGFSQVLDPTLNYYRGPQFSTEGTVNFGMFLDSSPDRWGRLLIRRREVELSKTQSYIKKNLKESDYLLGVFDLHRQGGLRLKLDTNGPFLDDNKDYPTPPWTTIGKLEYASLQLEKEGIENNKDYVKWLNLLVNPGASLGGARPKASVIDAKGNLWIAKFPSRLDTEDKGGWEAVAYTLAILCGIVVAPFQAKIFSGKHHSFLTKRFDRASNRKRIHFASAMTLLQKTDGDDSTTGVSYLHLAEILLRIGAKPEKDLEELWRRIVFNICISNTDDHLRNHGFLLEENGWVLSPCYDINPSDTGVGLKLNISEDDNSQSLELALEVAGFFRLSHVKAKSILKEITKQIKNWRKIAKKYQINSSEQDRISNAFRNCE